MNVCGVCKGTFSHVYTQEWLYAHIFVHVYIVCSRVFTLWGPKFMSPCFLRHLPSSLSR